MIEIGGNQESVVSQIQVKDGGLIVKCQEGAGGKKTDQGIWQCGDLW